MVNSFFFKKKIIFSLFFLIIFTGVLLFSQNIEQNASNDALKKTQLDNKGSTQEENNTQEKSSRSLPLGFDEIKLYKTKDEIISIINKNEYFRVVREPEISFLPSTQEQLLTVEGKKFIKEGLFQFTKENSLKVIILYLDKTQSDYFTLYTLFYDKYGRPYSISPTQASWKDDNVRIIIEKPLTIKYVSIEKGKNQDKAQESSVISIKRKEREKFLSNF